MSKSGMLIAMLTCSLFACGGGDAPAVDANATQSGSGDGSGSGSTNGGKFATMCAIPSVIYCDGFENGTSGWTTEGIVAELTGAAINGEGSKIVEMRTYGAVQGSKLIRSFANEDTVYVRYDTRYATDYDNSGGSHGPILGGSMNPPWGMMGTAGKKPTGSDYFVLNFEPVAIYSAGTIGEFGFYTYYANMTPDGGGNYWGKIFRSDQSPPPVIVPGQWHCVEFNLALNTPGNNTDGSASFWVDGVQHRTVDGIQWRSSPSLQINAFILDSYNHFNNGARPATSPNRVQFDNVVISRAPIGCL